MNQKITADLIPQFFPTNDVMVYEIVEKDSPRIHLGELAIAFLNNGEKLYIANIYVEDYLRQHGIATQILQRVISFAKNFGISEIELFVPYTAEEAQKLYRKFGFQITQEKEHGYEMVWRK